MLILLEQQRNTHLAHSTYAHFYHALDVCGMEWSSMARGGLPAVFGLEIAGTWVTETEGIGEGFSGWPSREGTGSFIGE